MMFFTGKLWWKCIIVSIVALVSYFLSFSEGIAEFSEPNAIEFDFGNGDRYDPYLINSYDDLCKLRDYVDAGINCSNIYFKQTKDIVFPDDNWDPIGELSLEENVYYPFAGIYDGDGYTISNIICDTKYPGLFAFLSGEVRNVGIESGLFVGEYAGSLTSHGTEEGRIINCYNKATVNGTFRAGGIADNFKGLISFSWNMGAVSGDSSETICREICSYDAKYVYYCFSSKQEQLVNNSTFSGTIEHCESISNTAESNPLKVYYQGLWDIYCKKQKAEYKFHRSRKKTIDPWENVEINRGTICFLFYDRDGLKYSKSFEPEQFAAETVAGKEKYYSLYNSRFSFSGEGSKEKPFLISSYQDLCLLRDCVDNGENYRGFYFEQTDDISIPKGVNWNPIGELINLDPLRPSYVFSLPFSGTYNGNGHVVRDIYSEQYYAGLFTFLDGTVCNLGIENGMILGEYIGSITSHGGSNGKIVNCYNKAMIIGRYRAGGICDNFSGKIYNCINSGYVLTLSKKGRSAEICSYSCEEIAYCFSTNKAVLVSSLPFSGKVIESEYVSVSNLDTALRKSYEKSYNLLGQISDIKPIIYITAKNNSAGFDKSYRTNKERVQIWYSLTPLAVLLLISIIVILISAVIKGKLIRRKQLNEFPYTNKTDDESTNQGKLNIKKRFRNKNFWLRLSSAALTIFVLCILLKITFSILDIDAESGMRNLERFESRPENKLADVLFLGGSTNVSNMELEVLWKNYGIAGYSLAANDGRLWDSYYQLVEAEKVKHNKLVVVDVSPTRISKEFAVYESYQVANIAAHNISIDKIKYINAAVANPDQRLYYLLRFPLSHNRYTSLNCYDFLDYGEFGEDNKGAWLNWTEKQKNNRLDNVKDTTDYYMIDEKEEVYLRAIINYCKERDIDLLLIKTPDANRLIHQRFYNTASLIAEENGVPFLNINDFDEVTGIVPSDFANDTIHTNVLGGRKAAGFLGGYLKENYLLVDHRGDEAYNSWERFAANKEDLYLRAISGAEDYINELLRDNRKVSIIPYKVDLKQYGDQIQLFEDEGLQYRLIDEEDVLYGKDKEITLAEGNNSIDIIKQYDNCSISVHGNLTYRVSTRTPGLLVIVYDDINDKIGDISIIPFSDSESIEHLLSTVSDLTI